MWIVSNIIVNSRAEMTQYVELCARNWRFMSRKVTILAAPTISSYKGNKGRGTKQNPTKFMYYWSIFFAVYFLKFSYSSMNTMI